MWQQRGHRRQHGSKGEEGCGCPRQNTRPGGRYSERQSAEKVAYAQQRIERNKRSYLESPRVPIDHPQIALDKLRCHRSNGCQDEEFREDEACLYTIGAGLEYRFDRQYLRPDRVRLYKFGQ